MILTQASGEVVPVPSDPTHELCAACGSIKRKVRQRKNMPKPVIAPNPYDQPVQVSPAAKHLLAAGQDQVAKAKAKAKRLAFAERAANWSPVRIHEELDKIDAAVHAHEQKIAECLRQRMILEDQLAQAQALPTPGVAVKEVPIGSAQDPAQPTTPASLDPNVCPF